MNKIVSLFLLIVCIGQSGSAQNNYEKQVRETDKMLGVMIDTYVNVYNYRSTLNSQPDFKLLGEQKILYKKSTYTYTCNMGKISIKIQRNDSILQVEESTTRNKSRVVKLNEKPVFGDLLPENAPYAKTLVWFDYLQLKELELSVKMTLEFPKQLQDLTLIISQLENEKNVWIRAIRGKPDSTVLKVLSDSFSVGSKADFYLTINREIQVLKETQSRKNEMNGETFEKKIQIKERIIDSNTASRRFIQRLQRTRRLL